MKGAQVEIRRIKAEDTIDIRHRVMWPDRPRDSVIVPDDRRATHFGAFIDARLIGVASFFPDKVSDIGPVRLRKLAVDPQHQRKGVAGAMIEHAIEVLKQQGCTQLWCDARVTAAGFYQSFGFCLEEEVFQKNGLRYQIAKRAL